ncbi:MAG: 3-phosphoshikimate 1-carboxyvinyltransferase [Oscillospiraceae bacterium]|nr:3-phosphoshikimate 1-carboxyvinyltransferase [Oscillospiraceae bacterium]
MKAIIKPSPLGGCIKAIPSKSRAHRLLICAALSDRQTRICCDRTSQDIEATVCCLGSLGADIVRDGEGYTVTPVTHDALHTRPILNCGESGSTYRFLTPLVCALGTGACFELKGRLPERPMDELWSVLEAHGAEISGKGSDIVGIEGRLSPGLYTIPGNISSQYISGLLFALPLLEGDSRIDIVGELASGDYVRMTLEALRAFSIHIEERDSCFIVPGGQKYVSPAELITEGDWSNAAFWLCAGALSPEGITVSGLDLNSSQGDRRICGILRRFGADVSAENGRVVVRSAPLQGIDIDADMIPDLVPAIAVTASRAEGVTRIENAGRLRIKESDRLFAVADTIYSLGGIARTEGDNMYIRGVKTLRGGEVDSHGDHRIAMLAAVAGSFGSGPVTISGAQAVSKSYPDFYEDLVSLGGCVTEEDEQ